MNKRLGVSMAFRVATVAVVALLAACATQSIPTERLAYAAFITSGSTNTWTLISGGLSEVSVAAVDGVEAPKPYGPIELSPGQHVIRMKCDKNTTEERLSVSAGEVYEFAILYNRGVCEGTLLLVKSPKK